MDLRRTRTFVTVADLGYVSKAALRLRIAQPALSRQISELEQEVGFKLFDRVGRRLVLTGEGEQLLKDCRGLLNYASALDERAQHLRRGDTGVLKVAASPQFIDGVISEFPAALQAPLPRCRCQAVRGYGRHDRDGDAGARRDPSRAKPRSMPSSPTIALRQLSAGRGRTAGRQPSVSEARQGRQGRDRRAEVPSAAGPGQQLHLPADLRRRLPAWPASSRTSSSKAEGRTRCWRWRKAATASPSCRQP